MQRKNNLKKRYLNQTSYRVLFSTCAFILAQGAPIGFLIYLYFGNSSTTTNIYEFGLEQIAQHQAYLLYIWLGTSIVFSLFGFFLGTAADKLFKINFFKDRFLSIVAHDLRNPVGNISSFSELLIDENELTDMDRKEIYKRIQQQSQFMLRLLDELLDFSKIESGKMNVSVQKFILNERVQFCVESNKVRADEKLIKLVYEEKCDPIVVKMDMLKLEQMLNNLISNAIKFSYSKSIVNITLKTKQSMSEICISDQGKGIPEKDLKLIFHPFTTAGSKGTNNEKSNGLGLSIAKKIVEIHDGKIWAESEEGKGSQFFVQLPILNETKNLAQNTEDQSEVETKDNQKLKLLIAEDCVDNQKLVEMLLKKLPYEITIVENGAQALEAIKKNSYDIIFMDIQMPILSGLEASKKIRTWEEAHSQQKVPIVAMSAYGAKEDIEKTKLSGCDMHLIKPISKQKLLNAIHSTLMPH